MAVIFSSPIDISEDFFTPEYIATHKDDFNSLLFRSDEFKNNHNGKHILFSGCSYTYGSGLELNEVWSKIVYDKISKEEKCSGYFNFGVYGHGIIHIVSNLFKYFKKYGNPDIIFINLPDMPRFTGYIEKNKEYKIIREDGTLKEGMINYFTYEYYFMFEQYCNSNNIKLFSFTWDFEQDGKYSKHNKKNIDTQSFFNKFNFKTFYNINKEDFYKNLQNLIKNDNSKFSITARDGYHPGTSFHINYANFIYNKYMESL
jgi:hypothetical protein